MDAHETLTGHSTILSGVLGDLDEDSLDALAIGDVVAEVLSDRFDIWDADRA
ncbi:MAG: hypothetical protein ACRDQZ_20725 [Mycobacteriales bacterium]